MVTGLLLVKLTSGKEKQALTKLRALKSVIHMSAVFGRWDLVLDMEADDLPALSNIIVQEIRP
ncbi:MAG: Lrp/AsnC ligand binding domain-containing protein, partial [Elusimicrobiota bacterium]|nr:Lrp/AsnC ligand binding domain-containing protein [Elusimicrobiota bacterium]